MKNDPDKWFLDRLSPYVVQLYSLKEVVYSGQTRFQAVEIISTHGFGKCLVLDGKVQSSEVDEFIYHEALVHPALLSHPHPETVFIAGGGEGATLRETLAHRSVERAVMVDLDQEVVEICRRFLPSWHQGAFDDPRAELRYEDARKYLAESEEKFDIIIIDVSDPVEGGPAYLLYTEQFYRLAREKLTPQGLLAVQAGACAWGDLQSFVAVNHTLSAVFPLVFPYQTHIPSFGTLWGFCLASLGVDPLGLSVEEVERRISTRLSRRLRFYDGLSHQGLFSLPKYLRDELSREKRIITDQNPLFVL
jgi:spermidine synthase